MGYVLQPFEWIRIAWIRTGGIRMGGIRLEWICVGYVRCAGYVWDICVVDTFGMDMCGICVMCWICVGYVWCEIRKQSSEEPCDETSFGNKCEYIHIYIQINLIIFFKNVSVRTIPHLSSQDS